MRLMVSISYPIVLRKKSANETNRQRRECFKGVFQGSVSTLDGNSHRLFGFSHIALQHDSLLPKFCLYLKDFGFITMCGIPLSHTWTKSDGSEKVRESFMPRRTKKRLDYDRDFQSFVYFTDRNFYLGKTGVKT